MTRAHESRPPHPLAEPPAEGFEGSARIDPDLADIRVERQRLWIDGAAVRARSGRFVPALDPLTSERLGEIAEASPKDVDDAVKAAGRGLRRWSRKRGAERAAVLFDFARRLEEQALSLAVLETRETGAPIRRSHAQELPLAVRTAYWYAGWTDKLAHARRDCREPAPVGVCAAILPGRSALLGAVQRLMPALAAGCAIVLLPSPRASLGALRLARLLGDCGLPDGVVNVVTGAARTAAMLAGHPDLALLAFGGSAAVASEVRRSAARSGARLLIEPNGRGPDLLCDDAALEDAVDGVVRALGVSPAPACGLGSTLLVQEGLEADLCRWLEQRLARLHVGDPLDPDTELGPVPDPGRAEAIAALLALAREEHGVRVVQCGPGGADTPGEAQARSTAGRWCRPGFFAGVQPDQALAGIEACGPFFVVQSFRSDDEAVARARALARGLPGSVWSARGGRMLGLMAGLDSAVVHGNGAQRRDAAAPWGGGPEGEGRSGGVQGLWPYLE